NQVDFGKGTQSVNLRIAVAPASVGRTISLVIDNGSGPQEIATFTTTSTGSAAAYVVSPDILLNTTVQGVYDLYLKGVGNTGDAQGADICNIDWIQLNKKENDGNLYYDGREFSGCDNPNSAGTYLPRDQFETNPHEPADINNPAVGSPVISPAVTVKVTVKKE
ncbi:MAG TPA: carbohydrate-binding protein, partial [Bacteroidales bacterium]